MRLGAFHRLLVSWVAAPCLLTIEVPFSGTILTTRGILRAHHSLFSMRGWALEPDAGATSERDTVLHFDQMRRRAIDDAGAAPVLRFWSDGEAMRFSLRRVDD